MLASWLHDLNPFVWRINGDFGIRWYGLAYLLGFFTAYLILRWLARRGATPIPRERAADVVIAAALGAVIGGRIGYVLLYQPSLLWDFSGSIPFWGVLAINKGGMASHGGMLGVLVAAWLVSRGFKDETGRRAHRSSPLHVLDQFALMTPPGLLFGRLANFINGELLGRTVAPAGETGPWWGVRFPQEVTEHPEQIETSTWTALEQVLGTPSTNADGQLTDTFIRAYEGLTRELQSGSAEATRQLGPLITTRHPSQIYQAVAEGLVVGAFVWLVARRPHRAGVIAATFMVVYGIGRIVTEFWRLPDAHLTVQRFAGLSRGQWLSAVLALAGIGLFFVTRLRPTPTMPGWRRTPVSTQP